MAGVHILYSVPFGTGTILRVPIWKNGANVVPRLPPAQKPNGAEGRQSWLTVTCCLSSRAAVCGVSSNCRTSVRGGTHHASGSREPAPAVSCVALAPTGVRRAGVSERERRGSAGNHRNASVSVRVRRSRPHLAKSMRSTFLDALLAPSFGTPVRRLHAELGDD